MLVDYRKLDTFLHRLNPRISLMFVLGVIIASIIGTLIMIPAYPIYRRIARKTKADLSPEILRLSEEIIKS